MGKKLVVLLLCAVLVLGFAACNAAGNDLDAQAEGKIRVMVSFNALKEFAEAVGGEKVAVSTIIPDGTEAHDFELKAQDLASLARADIFVYNGLGMERWAEKAIAAAGNENLIVVVASEGADLIERTGNDKAHDHEHDEGRYDPHLWLSVKGAATEAENIKNALVQADPANREYYEANCKAFVSRLDTLYDEYYEKFSQVEKKSFVTGHAAFGYLCRDFGLTQLSVMDIFAGGEPSAQQLAALVEYCRENDVKTIFAEEMASPAVSQTLAAEVGAKVETIFTMETSEDGRSYLERMEDNLIRIYESLAH
ncbi:MAG: metal ABC transporter substrate-binding protein [Christensenellales bacterium]|jgi:zinc transport system substrate-binding protein